MNTLNSHEQKSRGGLPEVAPWLGRLLGAEVPGLGEKERAWWAVWIGRFLRHCREDGNFHGEGVIACAKGYLGSLERDGVTEDWKREQAREALRVFVRGTENWTWEERRPSFRMRSGAAGSRSGIVMEAGRKEEGEAAKGEAAAKVEEAVGKPVVGDLRERLVAALRCQHYAYEALPPCDGAPVRGSAESLGRVCGPAAEMSAEGRPRGHERCEQANLKAGRLAGRSGGGPRLGGVSPRGGGDSRLRDGRDHAGTGAVGSGEAAAPGRAAGAPHRWLDDPGAFAIGEEDIRIALDLQAFFATAVPIRR